MGREKDITITILTCNNLKETKIYCNYTKREKEEEKDEMLVPSSPSFFSPTSPLPRPPSLASLPMQTPASLSLRFPLANNGA